jgi:TolB protein
MKNIMLNSIKVILASVLAALACNLASAQNQQGLDLNVEVPVLGQTKPILVSLDGLSGEAAAVVEFDLYVQGFNFVTPDAAQYQISGSSDGNVQGRVVARFAKNTILTRSYTGASLRRQAHAFADDIVQAITHKNGIGQTKIAFKAQPGTGSGEIYVSDFDGHGAEAVTHDGAIVAAPAWVPGKMAIYYTSYQPGNPDIFYHNLSTGQRRIIAGYSGLNTSAAVSPDGSRVAMILSRHGSPDVWVSDANGSNLKQLTSTPEDESSPCWSPDGRSICFVTRITERRVLAKVSASGGAFQRIPTAGAPNPTEPDWSPDGKWIAFTSQAGGFSICVMPADGSAAPTVLVSGEDPSWAPNSRTLICNRRTGGHYVLSVLDVFTKQVKDVPRVLDSDSQPAWAR